MRHFVKNTKKHADIIILDGSHNKIAIDLIKTKIKTKIKQKGSD